MDDPPRGCRLTEMMLRRYPELRANEYVLQAYYLILNAMEALAAEKKQMVERNQAVLRELVMAAKVSEAQLRSFLAANVDKVCLAAADASLGVSRGSMYAMGVQISSLDFSLFLDAEIQDAEYQSPAEQVLLAIKLNVLEARAQRSGATGPVSLVYHSLTPRCGSYRLGVDVRALPALAASSTADEMRQKVSAAPRCACSDGSDSGVVTHIDSGSHRALRSRCTGATGAEHTPAHRAAGEAVG